MAVTLSISTQLSFPCSPPSLCKSSENLIPISRRPLKAKERRQLLNLAPPPPLHDARMEGTSCFHNSSVGSKPKWRAFLPYGGSSQQVFPGDGTWLTCAAQPTLLSSLYPLANKIRIIFCCHLHYNFYFN